MEQLIIVNETEFYVEENNIKLTDDNLITLQRGVLLNMLLNIDNRCSMISMISDTPFELNRYKDYWLFIEGGKKRKNPNPTEYPDYEHIRKVSDKYKQIINFDYLKCVKNRMIKLGLNPENHVPKENWFYHVNSVLVKDKKTDSKFYLCYQRCDKSTLSSVYYNDKTKQFVNYNDIIDFVGKKQETPEHKPLFEVVNLNNILKISINKQKYRLIGTV